MTSVLSAAGTPTAASAAMQVGALPARLGRGEDLAEARVAAVDRDRAEAGDAERGGRVHSASRSAIGAERLAGRGRGDAQPLDDLAAARQHRDRLGPAKLDSRREVWSPLMASRYRKCGAKGIATGVVELRRIEPLTSAVRLQRSPI